MNPILRIRDSFSLCGVALFPESTEAPCEIEADANQEVALLTLKGVRFEGAAEQVWVTVEQIEAVCAAVADLIGDVDGWATLPQVETWWRLLCRAAGQNAHYADSSCVCRGCLTAGRRLGRAAAEVSL